MLNRSKNGSEPDVMPKPPAPRAPMPRAANVPPVRVYDDDVLAQFQRFKDLQVENDHLTAEVEAWRRRALDAEAECKRLEIRIEHDRRQAEQDLAKRDDEHAAKLGTISADLDFQKSENVRVTTLAQAGASVFLQILDLKHKAAPAADAAGKAGLAAIADELGKDDPEFREVDEPPLPRVVAAGPRLDHDQH